MIADIYAKNRTRVPSSEEGRGREHLGFCVTAFTLGNLTHHKRQPKPSTTTEDLAAPAEFCRSFSVASHPFSLC